MTIDSIRSADRFESDGSQGTRAVVDGHGRLVDLTIEPDLLARPARMVAQAVFEAVVAAQGAADDAAGADPTIGKDLTEALLQAELLAERQFTELEVLVSDLRRLDGPR
jgi:hypothetical protein